MKPACMSNGVAITFVRFPGAARMPRLTRSRSEKPDSQVHTILFRLAPKAEEDMVEQWTVFNLQRRQRQPPLREGCPPH
jgi:hypothetical protein